MGDSSIWFMSFLFLFLDVSPLLAFDNFFTFWYNNLFQAHLVYFQSQKWIKLGAFLWKSYLIIAILIGYMI